MPETKILTIIGARPQIIKAAALSRTIRTKFPEIQEITLHTGQHYDKNMSQVFFDELDIPEPKINLNIGSGSHGKQTGLMLNGIEEALLAEKPDFVVVYGDTNSTLAGALSGVKLHIPVVHIEAGLRSFNKSMPEEINRIMCDHASTLLFVPSKTGIKNLEHEGFMIHNKTPFSVDNPGVFHCGDIMFDNLVHFEKIAEQQVELLKILKLDVSDFVLCTIHRDSNTDSPEKLQQIIKAICNISEKSGLKIVIPLHPRTSKIIENNLPPELFKRLISNKNIHLLPPVSYLEMLMLEKNSRLIITDSGGVQKEAYFFEKPLIVARPETEWVEIIENGAGLVTDADEHRIFKAAEYFLQKENLIFPPVFGDGLATEFICRTILEQV